VDSTIREGLFRNYGSSPLSGPGGNAALLIPLGERVMLQLKFFNPLPVDLSLRDLQIILNIPESFDVIGTDITIPSGTTKDVTLVATPLSLGTFRIESTSWYLGTRVQIIQHIRKKGLLLQKTLTQRAHHQRSPDTSLTFNVIETCPLLRLDIGKEIENVEVLNGEIIRTTLSIVNEGSAAAKNIELIFNYPIGALELFHVSKDSSDINYDSDTTKTVRFLPFIGQSCTAVRIPNDISLRSGGSIQLRVWVRCQDIGKLEISLLASYQSALSDRVSPRTSYSSFNVTVLPSVDLSMTLIPRQASPTSKSMLLNATNKIPADELASRYGIIDPISSSPGAIPPDMERAGDGCFCITGMLYLGAGQVNGEIVGVYRNDANKNEKHVANSSEKISLFIPIELNDPSDIIANPQLLLPAYGAPPAWLMKS
jgi:hypothetical protein